MDDNNNNNNNDGVSRQILANSVYQILENANPATKKLFTYLERKHEYHVLLRNEIDKSLEDFVTRLERTRKTLPKSVAPFSMPLSRKFPSRY